MCKVHNSVGSLTDIKSHLRKHNVNEFKSINELINFQKNYSVTQQQIISNHSLLVEQEKNTLSKEIAQLNDSIKIRKSQVEWQLQLELEKLQQQLEHLTSTYSNIFQAFIGRLKKIVIEKRIRNSKLNFNSKIEDSVLQSINLLTKKNNRYQYIVSHFGEAVNERSLSQRQALERKKRIIDGLNSSIYGALGEQKVVKELENLSDEYILINNFTYSFHPAIYNRQENDYIKSIQIDHLLISPAGIFLIETKNWSEHSLQNQSLRSPVQQIKRSNFALFKILAGKITNSNLILNQHHWGDRKISIRNLIVFTNQKPSEEFQYVKILSLKELLGYVTYFKPTFSNKETQMIANYLLNLNGQNNPVNESF
jgi:hypothetical protein